MPRNRTPLDGPPTDPDPLDAHVGDAGEWGLPSDEGLRGQQPAALAPSGYDYSGGVLVGHTLDANAQPSLPAAHILGAVTDAPRAYEMPHEATHRRYEPLLRTSIAQAAAGYTSIAVPIGLHYVKMIAVCLTVDAAGSIKFQQGGDPVAGTGASDMTGAITLAQNGGFVLPPAELPNPWLYTAPDLPFGLFTVTGKANGWIMWAQAPYDQ